MMMTSLLGLAELSTAAATWLTILLDFSVKGAVLLAAAAALVYLLRGASAAARHLVWTLSLAGLLALPVISAVVPVWQVSILPVPAAAEAVSSKPLTPKASQSTADAIAAEVVRSEVSVTANRQSPDQQPGENLIAGAPRNATPNLSAWALTIWIMGAGAALGRLLVGWARVWLIARRSDQITDAGWLSLACRLAHGLGLRRDVVLLKSERVSMPQTWGSRKAVILLPPDADRWTSERRHIVLLHELAHVKRLDCLTQTLAQIACALYWFNPLVWLAARRLRVERELACDDHVLGTGTRATDYADHLLDIARSMQSAKCPSMAAIAIARRSQLEGRLLAILDPTLRRGGPTRRASIVVGVAICSVILPLAALRPVAQANPKARPESSARAEQADLYPSTISAAAARAQSVVTQKEGKEVEQQTEQPPESLAEEVTVPEELQDQPQATKPDQPKEASGAVQALVEALKDSDEQVRKEALTALAHIGGGAAVEALRLALKDADWQVREQAAWGLGLRGGPEAVDHLIGALRDQHPQVRHQAAWALGLKGDTRSVEPLAAALRDENEQVREQAAWALGLKGDRRALAALAAALKDQSPQVRSQAAWALGLKGDGSVVDDLIAALKDEQPQVRSQAAWALGLRQDRRAAQALSAAMKDPNKQVRQQAAWALGMILVGSDSDDGPNINIDVNPDKDSNDSSDVGDVNPNPDPFPDREDADQHKARPKRQPKPVIKRANL